MPAADDVAQWISQLADSDPAKRRAAATRLHSAGTALCLSATREWLKDIEFRGLVRPALPDAAVDSIAEGVRCTVGIAVQPETFQRIRALRGSPRLADVPPDQDAMEFELRPDDREDFDILTTREPGGAGAIARYLQKFGEGIQQIEIAVASVDRATEILRERFGLSPVYPATRPGADGTRVNFFLARAAEGKKVLIELVELPQKK